MPGPTSTCMRAARSSRGWRRTPGPRCDRSATCGSMYWGQLGWLDYSLPRWCSTDPAVPAMVWGPAKRGGARAAPAGAGLFRRLLRGLRGRPCTPSSISTSTRRATSSRAAISCRRRLGSAPDCCSTTDAPRARPWWRRSVVLNVLLFGATVQRYYGGDWRLAWRAMPFAAPDGRPADVHGALPCRRAARSELAMPVTCRCGCDDTSRCTPDAGEQRRRATCGTASC